MKYWICLLHLLIPPVVIPADGDRHSNHAPITTENKAAWLPLFESLAAQPPIVSTFTERRTFPFRNTPVILRGELRISPERGLSLRYLEPRDRMMIVDEKGVVLRDARGRSRAMRSDPRAPDADAALLAVLRFDLDELLQTYEVAAAGDEGTWEFVFTPRDEVVRESIGQITVSGRNDGVDRLDFRRSESQRVEIEIGATETGATFSPEELEKFFR